MAPYLFQMIKEKKISIPLANMVYDWTKACVIFETVMENKLTWTFSLCWFHFHMLQSTKWPFITHILSGYIAFSAFSSPSQRKRLRGRYWVNIHLLHQISNKGGRETDDMINGTTYEIPSFKGMWYVTISGLDPLCIIFLIIIITAVFSITPALKIFFFFF